MKFSFGAIVLSAACLWAPAVQGSTLLRGAETHRQLPQEGVVFTRRLQSGDSCQAPGMVCYLLPPRPGALVPIPECKCCMGACAGTRTDVTTAGTQTVSYDSTNPANNQNVQVRGGNRNL